MSTSLQQPHEPLPQEPGDPAGGQGLDNAVWAALNGPHRHLAEFAGGAARYRPGVSPFAGVADLADPRCWDDLAALVGPGGSFLISPLPDAPTQWTGGRVQGFQMIGTAMRGEVEPEAVRLGPADVPDMLALVRATRPGPFEPATIEMGDYFGVRRGGRLIAMAGERLRLAGWTEISAVCTDPEHRGQGLAARLMRHVAVGILDRGDTPFLHVADDNAPAIRLYEALGFTVRRPTSFNFLQVPA